MATTATTATLGNFNNVSVDPSGAVKVSGIGSGIDWSSVTDSLVKARSAPIDQLTATNTANAKQLVAYSDLQTLLGNFRDSLNTLRGAVSFDNSTDGFSAKQIFTSVARTDGLTPNAATNIAAVTATNGAATGSHSIEVLQTATAAKISSDSFTSTTAALGLTDGDSFTINGKAITVSSADTLLSLRDRINSANSGASPSGVSASIVSVSATQNFLVLTATQTGEPITVANTTGTPLDTIGVTSGGLFKHELVQAQTAQLYADGLLDQSNTTYESARQTSAAVTLGSNGTIRFNDGTTTRDLAYTSGQSIQTLADNINGDATLQGMGISASVVTEGAQVRLKLTTTGAAFTTTETGGGAALSDLGMNNSRQLIERDTNSVSDLFAGVTLNLLQAEVGTTVEIDVTPDLSSIKTAITSFASAYNALKVFINQQTQIDSTTGVPSADSVLAKSQTLKTLSTQINSVFGRDTATNTQTFRVLADIGLNFVDDTTLSDKTQANTLQIDQTKLNNALNANVDDVRRLFSFDFTSSDPRVSLLSYSSKTTPTAGGYTLNVGPVVTVQQSTSSVTSSSDTLNSGTSVGATTSGSFVLNGTTITYDVTTDTLESLATKITAAAIPNVSASITTSSSGTKQLVINSSSSASPVALSGDTGDFLSHAAFGVSARAVTQANIGGAADGSDNGTVTISGTTLTVTNASGAEGLILEYNGTAAVSGINLDFTVGIGAALYNVAAPAMDPISGSVQNEIDSLNTQDTANETRIAQLQDQMTSYRAQLVARFAAAESAMSTANSLLDTVTKAFDGLSGNGN
jgi:flagellar hook-associated protein 2